MLTTRFYNWLTALAMTNTAGAESVFLAVGGGDSAWDAQVPEYDPTTSTLVAETARLPLSAGNVTYLEQDGSPSEAPSRQRRLSVVLGPGLGTGTLREAGLFVDADVAADSGDLVSYFIHPRFDKSADMRLERAFTLNLQPVTFAAGLVQTRYLGNAKTTEFHDLDNLTDNCQVEKIRWDRRVFFASPEHATGLAYDHCAYCFPCHLSRR